MERRSRAAASRVSEGQDEGAQHAPLGTSWSLSELRRHDGARINTHDPLGLARGRALRSALGRAADRRQQKDSGNDHEHRAQHERGEGPARQPPRSVPVASHDGDEAHHREGAPREEDLARPIAVPPHQGPSQESEDEEEGERHQRSLRELEDTLFHFVFVSITLLNPLRAGEMAPHAAKSDHRNVGSSPWSVSLAGSGRNAEAALALVSEKPVPSRSRGSQDRLAAGALASIDSK